MSKEKKAGDWDYDGACIPAKAWGGVGYRTFSVGIFQWLPTKDGRGLKRGRVVCRVSGRVSDSDAVLAQVHTLILGLERGLRPTQKTYRAGTA